MSAPSGHWYRADVDGLRAVAIVAVLAYHAEPKLVPGGFVGVDIFFVISGFLISSLILDELRAGRFSFATFYLRRARRLFPALIAVLLGTWLLALAVQIPAELHALGKHMIAAAAFAANILNFAEAGYFDAPSITKPLLHLWSLGVEEQFYLVFPLLLLMLWRLPRLRLWLALIALASFALNVATFREHPDFAFYLPLTRFWEFLAGVLLARGLAEQSHAAPPLARDALSGAGLLAIVAAIAITRSDSFPGWIAALPVLGTAAIIAAGPTAWLNRIVLAHPKVVYVGLISYPLYLWHWPLIVLGRAVMSRMPNAHERTTALIAVALAVVLAAVTYRFIEQPIRRVDPARLRRTGLRLAGGLAATSLLGLATVATYGFLFVYPPAVQALLVPLQPTQMELPEPTGGRVIAAYGDSHAGHLLPGLLALEAREKFKIAEVNWWRCAPIGEVKPNDRRRCAEVTTENAEVLARLKPAVVIVAAFWQHYPHLVRLPDVVRALQGMGARVVIVGPVPLWPKAPQMMLYERFRSDRAIPDRLPLPDTTTRDLDHQLRAAAAAMGVAYVSLYDVLCDAGGCLMRLGDTAADIVQVDRTHLSPSASRYVVERVAQTIFGSTGQR